MEASLNILNIQARERNRFKATQMAEMKHSHEKEWEIRIEEACRSGVALMRRFLGLSNNALQMVALKGKLSSEARNLLDKEIRYLCRHMHVLFCSSYHKQTVSISIRPSQPGPETTYRTTYTTRRSK